MAKEDKVSDLTEMDDVLDQIKHIERAVKAQTLTKMLTTLKQNARKVLELKEEALASLKALGISEADTKRVIDFINNSSEVQLSESDVKKIHEEVKQSISSKKKNAQEELEKRLTTFAAGINSVNVPFIGYSNAIGKISNGDYLVSNGYGSGIGTTLTNNTISDSTVRYASNALVTLTSSDGSLDISI